MDDLEQAVDDPQYAEAIEEELDSENLARFRESLEGMQKMKEAKRPRTPKELRETMGSGETVSKLGLKGSANEVQLLIFVDGTRGIYKPASGEDEDLRSGVKQGTYWRREIASSSLAEALGFGDLVPTTTRRGEEEASIQHYVENAQPATQAPGNKRFDGPKDMARAAVFDYLTGNLDRHSGNWLVKADGKLTLIDNGLSFPTKYDEDDFANMRFWGEAVRTGARVPKEFARLKGKWPEVEASLKEAGIEGEAIGLAKARFDSLVKHAGQEFYKLPSLLDPAKDMRYLVNEFSAG